MPESLTCDAVEERALVARYLARQLARDEEEAFEAHYLTCGRCQQDIRLGVGLRGSLGEPAARGRRPARLWFTAGLAAAAVVAGVLVLRPAGTRDELRSLGAVLEPPTYLGVQVRATPSRVDSLFETAMADYLERRYGTAVHGLEAALTAGADSLAGDFFLASSLLMERRPREAAAAYRRVTAKGDTPYLDEAHYYLAKALLRLGRGEEAVEQLRLVSSRDDALGLASRALADSVEALISR